MSRDGVKTPSVIAPKGRSHLAEPPCHCPKGTTPSRSPHVIATSLCVIATKGQSPSTARERFPFPTTCMIPRCARNNTRPFGTHLAPSRYFNHLSACHARRTRRHGGCLSLTHPDVIAAKGQSHLAARERFHSPPREGWLRKK